MVADDIPESYCLAKQHGLPHRMVRQAVDTERSLAAAARQRSDYFFV